MLTFRIAITTAVIAFTTAATALLVFTELKTSHAVARAAASAAMDAASANTLSRLEAELSGLSSVVDVLSSNRSLADSDDRSEQDGAIVLFKAALNRLPQADSFYVGYENGSWLQVRRLDVLGTPDREKLGAPSGAVYNINLVRPTSDKALPMRRIFEDEEGNMTGQLDLPDYGYDVRKRVWYRDTMQADRDLISSPYASFSIGTPMITLSAPLHGRVRGVIAADLKLDKFSEWVHAQRPGEHGAAVIFDSFGVLVAHPDFARMVEEARAHPSHPQLPEISEIRTGLVGAVLQMWHGDERFEGDMRGEDGRDYLFRLQKFSQGGGYSGYSLLIAAEDDFAENVRKLQIRGMLIALIVGACFVPAAWIFGSRMSTSLKQITEQASRLQTLAVPRGAPVVSNIAEINELGRTMAVARRSIASFARFVPKDIVRGIIDGSISTELGGMRREVTILFSDVTNFTGIAEAADPDVLMRQTSRHFAALTEAFFAEGGTVDKFIGDSVMVFWNAPHLQPDHVERACRAALSAKAASDALNAQFEAEGLPPFVVRIGIHFGDAVVGNVGSAERMNYTVLGNSVNLAARLEGLNKGYGTTILVSEAVRSRVEHRFRFKPIASVTAKGMTTETRVYELVEAAFAQRRPSAFRTSC
ncbi:adenylate/guanylate cyclase domain-containing protein [Bradyrhizobium iriomotense]|uniref:Adenylate/guanylate cyclase domain-containing protein n=1 Tax=Bradyrhizobium iriomotense TaxID=441950 RepID=A0ABQ6B4N8_9BRAD|nr:adenylate/guanylate cyclase domain-containing protein [Bradyrhizobium iriomotense]GLR89053.1 adenylate/guanylate cyclase domain-containing protein [Bradyrhizobium iriomotense]